MDDLTQKNKVRMLRTSYRLYILFIRWGFELSFGRIPKQGLINLDKIL